MRHRFGASLRVHVNPMPAVQGDGLVVRVPDSTTNVDFRVADHRAEAGQELLGLGTASYQFLLAANALHFRQANAVRIVGTDVYGGAPNPNQLLGHVWLGAAALQGF